MRVYTDAAGCRGTRLRPFLIAPGLAVAFLLGNVPLADAGYNHCRAVIGLGVMSRLTGDSNPAHCERHQGSKYCIAHEEQGNNYINCNAGSGHAHHHSNIFGRPSEGNPKAAAAARTAPPRPGSRGTSQYIQQTWLGSRAGDKIDVAWAPQSFLQVDLTELKRGQIISARASMATHGGLAGAVELAAWLDEKGKPSTQTRLTGVFQDVKFELVSHPNRIVSLQFRQPLTWSVPGNAETFDSELEGSINVELRTGK
jgi:hypothetical protein